MLDEIGILADSASGLANLIRSVFTRRLINEAFNRIIFILSGASDFLELATSKTSPLRNIITNPIYLGDLSHGETEELLRESLAKEQMEIDDAMVDYVYEHTHGHPYLVKTWSQLGRAIETSKRLTSHSGTH